MNQSIEDIKAVDVHAHFGTYPAKNKEYVKDALDIVPDDVLKHSKAANVRYTIVSSLLGLLPRGLNEPAAGNEEALLYTGRHEELFFWVVIDPRKPYTFIQAEEMLRGPKCLGIKIHPEEHKYRISEYGRMIFEFAAKHKAVIETHSGEQNSLPADFVKFADDHPEVTLILAHLGFGWDSDHSHQVRAVCQSRNGNIYTDTSSAQNIVPGILEWAVKQTGPEKILFGTDSPLYFAPMQRARVNSAYISYEDKCSILYANALRLFGDRVKCN